MQPGLDMFLNSVLQDRGGSGFLGASVSSTDKLLDQLQCVSCRNSGLVLEGMLRNHEEWSQPAPWTCVCSPFQRLLGASSRVHEPCS